MIETYQRWNSHHLDGFGCLGAGACLDRSGVHFARGPVARGPRPSGRAKQTKPHKASARVKAAMESAKEAKSASAGCISCHTSTDEASMHPTGTVTPRLCDVSRAAIRKVSVAAACRWTRRSTRPRRRRRTRRPRVSELWKSAANPERAYTKWLEESPEYIQFVNPGDLRVVDKTCGQLPRRRSAERPHQHDDDRSDAGGRTALYNNGAAPYKNARFGESYAPDGTPQRLQAFPAPNRGGDEVQGLAASPTSSRSLRWEVHAAAATMLRAFERGGSQERPRSAIRPGRRARTARCER